MSETTEGVKERARARMGKDFLGAPLILRECFTKRIVTENNMGLRRRKLDNPATNERVLEHNDRIRSTYGSLELLRISMDLTRDEIVEAYTNVAHAVVGDMIISIAQFEKRDPSDVSIETEVLTDFLPIHGGTHGNKVRDFCFENPSVIQTYYHYLEAIGVPRRWHL